MKIGPSGYDSGGGRRIEISTLTWLMLIIKYIKITH